MAPVKFSQYCSIAVMLFGLSVPAIAQTPAEAYQKGCAACHPSERVLAKIPRGESAMRRAWIADFMTRHPCERDDLKPLITDFLMQKSGAEPN